MALGAQDAPFLKPVYEGFGTKPRGGGTVPSLSVEVGRCVGSCVRGLSDLVVEVTPVPLLQVWE